MNVITEVVIVITSGQIGRGLNIKANSAWLITLNTIRIYHEGFVSKSKEILELKPAFTGGLLRDIWLVLD